MQTLELCILRYNGTKDFTAGRLFADGVYVCNTLEDEVREVEGLAVDKWKVYGKTAIPRGRYQVILSYSPKFKRILPEYLDVKGFTAIRGHSGNKTDDTLGCTLYGLEDGNDKDAWLGNSRAAETLVINMIDKSNKANKRCYVTVV